MLKRALVSAVMGGFVFVPSIALADAPTVLFGTGHAVALRNNGDVLTWGENTFCQLGRPSSTNYVATPALVMRNVKEIAVAVSHTFALTTDGKLYAWGGNGGLLGVGHEYDLCPTRIAFR